MYTHTCIYTDTYTYFLALPIRKPGGSDTPVANEHIQCPDLFSTKRNQGSLEKYMIPELASNTWRLTWKILLCQTVRGCSKKMGTCQKDTEASLNGAPTSKTRDNLSIKIKTVVTDYKLLVNKIGTHEFILM